MEKIKIIIFFFLFIIKLINSIIVIPFKTFIPTYEDKHYKLTKLETWKDNIIYTNISIGTPPQKINMIIDSKTFATNLFQHMCDIPISEFNRNDSSTFKITKNIIYSPMTRASIIEETIYFYNDLNMSELQAYTLFKIIYSDNNKEDQSYIYEYHNSTCINTGLKLFHKSEIEDDINIINQFAQNFKESYDFTFKYTSDDEGVIIIGAEPHVFSPSIYDEKNYRTVKAEDPKCQDITNWYMEFDEIYLSYKDKNSGNVAKKILNETRRMRIQFDLNIIYGPSDYHRLIKKYFFDGKTGKCFEKVEELFTWYYCDKIAEEIIAREFPPLYFKMNEFDKIFELNYKDLFKEEEGKLYFLILFSNSPQDYFDVGKIFLKKYTFTFNRETKLIGYYINKKNQENLTDDDSFFSSTTFIVLIICLVSAFTVIGFFIGKFTFDKIRKRRKNELDDLYEYKPTEEGDNINSNNNNYNSNEENKEGDHLGINQTETME